MRKFVLVVATLFMAVPAMAAVSNVGISCSEDFNEVTVSYTSDGNVIRAFGLNITVDTANITQVVPVDANYRIFPGQIVITGGDVTDYNTPYAPDDIGDANVTIEMGSLYTTDANYEDDPNAGYDMKPGLSGTLLKFYVDADCNYTITENAVVGGVVMEEPTEDANVTLCSGSAEVGCIVPDVVGETKADANTAITNANLVPNGTGVLSCEPLNEVLTQDPAGSTMVTCGSTVDYTYSLYQTTVPNVVGGTKDDADTAITAAGLDPNGTGVLSCEPLNEVLTQNPVGNTVVTCGSRVDYTYSLYQTTVPNVVGKAKAVADANITAAGLVPSGTGVNSCEPIDEVLTQDPLGSTVVTCGSTVNYTYSLYQTIVPNVINMLPGDANAAIIAAGLVPGTRTRTATCTKTQEGKIIVQNPTDGGNTATCGSSVATTLCECYYGQATATYNQWVAVGKPICWCYPRQCKGDADGLPYGKSNWWVAAPDLTILKSAWQIANGPVGAPGACADFDRLPYGKNNWRVAAPDLTILKSNWQIANGPAIGCAPGNRAP